MLALALTLVGNDRNDRKRNEKFEDNTLDCLSQCRVAPRQCLSRRGGPSHCLDVQRQPWGGGRQLQLERKKVSSSCWHLSKSVAI